MGSFVGAENAGGTNIDVLSGTWPAGVQSGDIAIMPWTFVNTATPTDPTQDAMSLLNDDTDGSCRQRILYRYCTGSESGTISTSTGATFNRQTWVLEVLRGYDFISGFSVRLETVTGTSHDNPSIDDLDGFNGNFPQDGDTILIISSTRDGATTTVTAPAGYQKRTNAEIGVVGSGGTHTVVADDGLDDQVALPEDPAAWTGYAASSGNAVTVTLALRPTATGAEFTVDQTDSTGLTDAAVLEQTKSVTDSVGLTDGTAITISTVVTDSTGLTDSALVEPSKLVTQTDSTGLTDSASLAQSKVVSDSTGLTDATALAQSKVTTDSAGHTDTALVVSGKAITQTDSAGLTDTQTLSQTHALTDSAGLTDTTSLTVGKVITDSAGLTDAASVGLVRGVTVTDSAGLSDATVIFRSPVLTDLVGLADATAFSQMYVLTDSAGMTDSAEASNYFPITFRPNTGTTPRPSSGITARPNNGITARP